MTGIGIVTSRAQQTVDSRFPHPNARQEKFYWRTVTLTFCEIKPFDQHVEGLSHDGNKTWSTTEQVLPPSFKPQFEGLLGLLVTQFELSVLADPRPQRRRSG